MLQSNYAIRVYLQVLLITVLFVAGASAQVSSQWRGVNRDGIYDGTGLLDAWPKDGPKLLFSVEGLGSGHSSSAITADRIFVTGMEKKKGYLHAFDKSGSPQWKIFYGSEWDESYPGVRGTPTVAGDRLYLISGKGRLVCFNSGDGKEVWAVDMVKDFKGQLTQWGYSESVLLDGDMLFCTPGGKSVAVAALDRNTGKTLWTTSVNGEKQGYCSPIMIRHAGKKILVTMLEKSIIGIEAATGTLLWKYEHATSYGVNANAPIYDNGSLLCFSGYNQGAVRLTLSSDGTTVKRAWSTPRFDVQIGGAVLLDGLLYGASHKKPAWHALDAKTGKIAYSSKEIGRGVVIAAGGMLYCYSEKGECALMKPDAKKFSVVSSFKVRKGSGQHWAHPVIAGGRLYIHHGDVLLVYNISK